MVVAPRPVSIAAAALVAVATAMSSATQAQTAAGIADGDGILIDGRTFEMVPGQHRGDVGRLVKALGARELGPGAIVFRAGDKLYIAGAPATSPHEPISIVYEPPKNPEHQKVYELVKQRRVLEILKGILAPFRLPVDLEIRTVGCDGVANAYFDHKGNQRTIRMCYEFLQVMLQELPNEAGAPRNDALIGQLFLVLLHEAGHAIYDIFDVPVLGSQEDAADQFAGYVMLQFGGDRAYRLIRGAAHAFRRIIARIKDKPDVTLPLTAFANEHSRPERRFYNLTCSAYGYDETLFAGLVDDEWLPESRARRCKAEFEDIRFALRQLVGRHVDKAVARTVIATRWLEAQ